MRRTLRRPHSRSALLAALLLLAMALVACADPIPTAPPRPALVIPEDPETRARRLATVLRDDARIAIDGSVARFAGVLNPASVERFFRELGPRRDQIDTLIINSAGGGVTSGRRIGDWVHKHGVTVVVNHLCFSSCANYIFTAAPRKIIRADALVGWHGSDQQYQYLAESRGITLDELIDEEVEAMFDRQEQIEAREIDDDERARMRPSMRDTIRRITSGIRAEQKFLDRIGVSIEALVYGQMPGRYDRYTASGAYGWTFRIEDMARFGIDNVTYEGEGDYPSEFADPRRPVIVYDVPPD